MTPNPIFRRNQKVKVIKTEKAHVIQMIEWSYSKATWKYLLKDTTHKHWFLESEIQLPDFEGIFNTLKHGGK